MFWSPVDDWSGRDDIGTHDATRTGCFSVAPHRKMCVGPKPDKEYKLRAAYWRKPQMLAADDDVPICPEAHHAIIVWRALMLLSGHDEATFALADAQAKYPACFRARANDRDDYKEPRPVPQRRDTYDFAGGHDLVSAAPAVSATRPPPGLHYE